MNITRKLIISHWLQSMYVYLNVICIIYSVFILNILKNIDYNDRTHRGYDKQSPTNLSHKLDQTHSDWFTSYFYQLIDIYLGGGVIDVWCNTTLIV